jgi:superfamily I DNA/RNA helicase
MIPLLKSKKSRVFGTGDSYQAIYSFRMAMADSMNVLKQNLNAKVFELPITYRCPLLVVKEAQVYVPGLQAASWAKEGIVATLKDEEMYKNLRIGDVILSRTNAPMIGVCLKLIKAGIPANIEGRDIGQNLISLIDKSKADSVPELIDWVENWRDMEVARLMKKDQDATHINDKAECVIALCEGFKSVSDIRNNIEKLFKDSDNGRIVLLSTTHKAKGKEYDRVFILKDTYRPYQNQEEKNLMYVAQTRSKNELYYVEGIDKKKHGKLEK